MTSIERQLYDACAQNGSFEKAKTITLTNPNLSISFKNDGDWTALHMACHLGHADIVELLLSHFPNIDPNIGDNSNRTPLLLACQGGHIKVAKILVDDDRVDINRPDENNIVLNCSWPIAESGTVWPST